MDDDEETKVGKGKLPFRAFFDTWEECLSEMQRYASLTWFTLGRKEDL